MDKKNNFSLLETMLWNPEDGYFILNYHLQRLKKAAIFFNFDVDIKEIENHLDKLVNSFENQNYKIRLLVDDNGKFCTEIYSLPKKINQELVKVVLAGEPVNSEDVFLYHKTTNRHIYQMAYDIAKGNNFNCDDVLLWNEKQEITETCFGNIVVELNGELLTPAVKSGLLAGTFRDSLLASGKITEGIIKIADLKDCDRLYIINSVQKWREATLISQLQTF